MSIEKKQWTTGETITADGLNSTAGYSVAQSEEVIWSGTITEVETDEDAGVAYYNVEELSLAGRPNNLTVVLNGTEYLLPLSSEDEYGSYFGEFDGKAPIFTTYPVFASVNGFGITFAFPINVSVPMTISAKTVVETVDTSEDFKKARGFGEVESVKTGELIGGNSDETSARTWSTVQFEETNINPDFDYTKVVRAVVSGSYTIRSNRTTEGDLDGVYELENSELVCKSNSTIKFKLTDEGIVANTVMMYIGNTTFFVSNVNMELFQQHIETSDNFTTAVKETVGNNLLPSAPNVFNAQYYLTAKNGNVNWNLLESLKLKTETMTFTANNGGEAKSIVTLANNSGRKMPGIQAKCIVPKLSDDRLIYLSDTFSSNISSTEMMDSFSLKVFNASSAQVQTNNNVTLTLYIFY